MAASTKWTLQSLGESLAVHIARQEDSDKKLDELYQTVVTGNGHPSMKTTVQKHDDWIGGVNKFIWIFITALIGELVLGLGGLLAVLYAVSRVPR
jgi:hypothetical protein